MITLSVVPHFGVEPCPEELRACPDRYLVLGFPIHDERFPCIDEVTKEAGLKLDNFKEERRPAMNLLEGVCEEVCEGI